MCLECTQSEGPAGDGFLAASRETCGRLLSSALRRRRNYALRNRASKPRFETVRRKLRASKTTSLGQDHGDHRSNAALIQSEQWRRVVGEPIETQEQESRSLKRKLHAARMNRTQEFFEILVRDTCQSA